MKILTRHLNDRALNYAVAKALEWTDYPTDSAEQGQYWHMNGKVYGPKMMKGAWHQTVDKWMDSLIDEHRISTTVDHSGVWIAYMRYNLNDERRYMSPGSTRQEAVKRCFVTWKLGVEVEIPEDPNLL